MCRWLLCFSWEESGFTEQIVKSEPLDGESMEVFIVGPVSLQFCLGREAPLKFLTFDQLGDFCPKKANLVVELLSGGARKIAEAHRSGQTTASGSKSW